MASGYSFGAGHWAGTSTELNSHRAFVANANILLEQADKKLLAVMAPAPDLKTTHG